MFLVMLLVASAMPKSGFSANSQAKVAANAIRGELTGSRVYDARFANTCWSLIATNDGVKVGANYKAGSEKIDVVDKFVSKTKKRRLIFAKQPMNNQSAGMTGSPAICFRKTTVKQMAEKPAIQVGFFGASFSNTDCNDV